MSRTRKGGGRPAYKQQKFQTETNLIRRGSRPERSSLLILCEGKTEKNYFTGMRTRRGPQIDVDHPGCDHLGVAKLAIKRRSDDYDAVWCVLDTELDRELTATLEQVAREGGVRLAMSTPCFEVWLILHLKDWTAPFQSAEEAKKALVRLLPTWTEASTRFSDFGDGVADACERARRLDPTSEDHMKNPSTSVWKLVERLR
jgi:hypothetical protein